MILIATFNVPDGNNDGKVDLSDLAKLILDISMLPYDPTFKLKP